MLSLSILAAILLLSAFLTTWLLVLTTKALHARRTGWRAWRFSS